MGATNSKPVTLEAFSLLQIAAEAFFGVEPNGTNNSSRNLTDLSDSQLSGYLKSGNKHSSLFTAEEADRFVKEWLVVDHQPSTSTSFSATLFRYKGETDPGRGLVNGQYVVRFRSTEFIDDYARDNAATNTLEVKAGGFAYGQIADMEDWWKSLKASYPDMDMGKVSVAGYGGSRH